MAGGVPEGGHRAGEVLEHPKWPRVICGPTRVWPQNGSMSSLCGTCERAQQACMGSKWAQIPCLGMPSGTRIRKKARAKPPKSVILLEMYRTGVLPNILGPALTRMPGPTPKTKHRSTDLHAHGLRKQHETRP